MAIPETLTSHQQLYTCIYRHYLCIYDLTDHFDFLGDRTSVSKPTTATAFRESTSLDLDRSIYRSPRWYHFMSMDKLQSHSASTAKLTNGSWISLIKLQSPPHDNRPLISQQASEPKHTGVVPCEVDQSLAEFLAVFSPDYSSPCHTGEQRHAIVSKRAYAGQPPAIFMLRTGCFSMLAPVD